MATFTKLASGSWRAQVRRKGRYVNESFLRRKDAEEWALEIERRIDRGEPVLASRACETKTIGDLVRLHRDDLREVGKQIGRSKAATLAFLERRLGRLRLPELDRDRLIKFGKERASEGAGPVTLGMDLGYIKTVLSHAAAVHGATVAVEPIDLARVALCRLGLVGKGAVATANLMASHWYLLTRIGVEACHKAIEFVLGRTHSGVLDPRGSRIGSFQPAGVPE